MRRLLVVVLGLVVLGADGYAAFRHFEAQVQPKMVQAADVALARAQLTGVTVTMDGRDARLAGEVSSDVSKRRAEQIVAAVEGVRSVDAGGLRVGGGEPGPILVPAAAPLDVTMTWDGETLVLAGQVPEQGLADAIVAEARARYREGAVQTQLVTVSGTAPPGAKRSAAALVRGLRRLHSGSASLGVDVARLDGVAADEATQDGVTKALAAGVGVGYAARSEIVVAPPAIDVAADTVVADGVEAAFDVVAEDAAVATAEADAVAGLAAEDATPAGEADAAVARPDAAEAGAADAATAGDAAAAAPVDPGGASPLTNAQCQSALDALVEGEARIQFRGWFAFTPEDEEKLAQAAALMKRCPEARITIEAYYDEHIEPDKGLRITAKRASLVQDRLVELGVSVERLSHRGMGYQNTRYPNTPVTMRVLNRRVEFRVEGER